MNISNIAKMPERNVIEMAPRLSKIVTISCCFVMSLLYVSSLYIWNNKHSRDHPSTVKGRFLSVSIMMIISPGFVYYFSSKEILQKVTFHELLGIRWNGFLMASTVPYLLTMLLYFGPLIVELQHGILRVLLDINYWKTSLNNMLWIRNNIMAPLSEEFVFRACMMPLILQSFPPLTSVFLTPVFFGVAHVHHIIERLNMGINFSTALIISLSQLVYTTLFGFYSSYLFARTGHFIASLLVHAFCNHIGLPDIQELLQYQIWQRSLFITCYILGFLGWISLLTYATQPHLYQNNIFWTLQEI